MNLGEADLARMNRVLRHRLRNFASGLKTAVSYLRKEADGCLPPAAMEYFPLILGECDGIADLTQRLNLCFDSLPEPGAGTVQDVLDGVQAFSRQAFPSAPLQMNCPDGVLGNTFPSPRWMTVVLSELVANAAEAAPGNAIDLSVIQQKNEIVFHLADQGAGLDDAQLTDALQPFFTTKARQLGVGLTIAVRLVEVMRGRMCANRKLSKGFCMAVYIPFDFEPMAGKPL